HERDPLVDLIAQLHRPMIGAQQSVSANRVFVKCRVYAVSQIECPTGIPALRVGTEDARERQAQLQKSALAHDWLKPRRNQTPAGRKSIANCSGRQVGGRHNLGALGVIVAEDELRGYYPGRARKRILKNEPRLNLRLITFRPDAAAEARALIRIKIRLAERR